MHDKREIYRAILNPKREQLFFVGTVTGAEPLQVRLDGDTADVPATNTSGGFFAAEGDRVVLLKYGKQFLCLGVINGVLGGGVDDLRDDVDNLRDNVEAHVDNTTDAHGIDDHFNATPEDDVHGLAGKVIVESGSNENGRYVIWDDGTQICTRTVTPDRTKQHTEQAFGFAKSFREAPAASASHAWGTNPTYQLSCATMFLATSSTQWRIAFTNTSATGADLPVRLTAIGRWK